ncbi:putative sickle tail protein -like [Scophthalmus maximus]|uniref:Putative sickle tail protein-like n=1 Tax=Scophthalmus maximus TaxID=52904 RepID=A0A2U9CV96_SCOMX|nr:putative sickle tail protein -like [Scophthalmus maximus]
MSKASRLARPPSAGAGSKLPSPRKECPGMAAAAGRVRVLSVGEKLMRAGSDGILNRHKSLRVAVPQDKAQSETLTERQALNQSPGERGENMGMVPPKSRISPPKASTQHQGSVHNVGNRGESSEGVTEGGQECEQGMLGNQQVLELCLCLNPSPR